MNRSIKIILSSLIGALSFLLISSPSFSQVQFNGRIISEEKKPIAYASVGVKGKKAGGITDSLGNFKILLPDFIKKTDTIVISSIGHQTLKLPVQTAVAQSEFQLAVTPRNLPSITLYSLNNQSMIGTKRQPDDVISFRGWYERKTGGEIGKIFSIPHSRYKIEKIMVRIENTCDTCLIRAHVRKVEQGFPSAELLDENIIVPVLKKESKDLFVLNLTDFNVLVSESKIFIGFEVMDCVYADPKISSVCFVGSEEGEYVFKSFVDSPWEKSDRANIDVQLSLRY